MIIHTKLGTMKGRTLNVRGVDYTIDDMLCIKDIPEDHAAVLLQGKNWFEGLPVTRRVRGPNANANRGDFKIKPILSKPLPEPEAPEEPAEPISDPEPAPPSEEAEATSPGVDAEAVAASHDGPVDPEGNPAEEWPDPSEDFSEDYLRKMADAYEVKYAKNTTKATLVKRLTKAMYE